MSTTILVMYKKVVAVVVMEIFRVFAKITRVNYDFRLGDFDENPQKLRYCRVVVGYIIWLENV